MADWDKLKERWNVEDRRWNPVGKTVWGITVTGLLLVAAVGYFGWADQAFQLLDTMQETQQVQQVDTSEFAWMDNYEKFSSTVLGSNNALWKKAFAASGEKYNEPRLVLFRGRTQSWCWVATSQIGPHYCPLDTTIYLDETFFDELTKKFWAKWGDVAEAYVIAHEVAHHIQKELKIMDEVHRIKRNWTKIEANQASVKLELQADCIAWIWASSIAGKWILEFNEISEAIDAAGAVWDDRIQEAAHWTTNPESWTHWSSADRKKWFTIWYKYANFDKCNTF